jgi:D-tagatose-1,6-bisphosphate aldolase subunit GatZ/KbaZ
MNRLAEIVAHHKAGAARGIFAICSAHPVVLTAGARLAAQTQAPLLVESTSNQVNQDGGYTGMTPDAFAACMADIARDAGLASDQVLLGGDHLGPYPWRSRPAAEAMQRARTLVAACVQAGYIKIHLDASAACADDSGVVPTAVAVERSADLCSAAEEAYRRRPSGSVPPCYAIGTEVPAPGGEAEETPIRVTTPDDAEATLEITRRAFARRGLDDAWERVVALVVQPGIGFSDATVHEYDRGLAAPLSRFIAGQPRLVYEAHSTDYQRPTGLRRLVEDHFAILKVGPALTHAFREAAFALAWMEREWLGDRPDVVLSDLPAVLDRVMLGDRRHWAAYHRGDPRRVAFALRYSYSDRARYYWAHPDVNAAMARLVENLERNPPPLTLLSQFLPEQYVGVRDGRLGLRPLEWGSDRIAAVLRQYAWACEAETTAKV